MWQTKKRLKIGSDYIRHTLVPQGYTTRVQALICFSGTGGKDGDINQDIFDDLLRLPTRNAHNTRKYTDDVMEMLKEVSRN